MKISKKVKVKAKKRKGDVAKKMTAEADATKTASPASQAVMESSQQTQAAAAADDGDGERRFYYFYYWPDRPGPYNGQRRNTCFSPSSTRFDSRHSRNFFRGKMINVAEVNKQRWLEESGQWL